MLLILAVFWNTMHIEGFTVVYSCLWLFVQAACLVFIGVSACHGHVVHACISGCSPKDFLYSAYVYVARFAPLSLLFFDFQRLKHTRMSFLGIVYCCCCCVWCFWLVGARACRFFSIGQQSKTLNCTHYGSSSSLKRKAVPLSLKSSCFAV